MGFTVEQNKVNGQASYDIVKNIILKIFYHYPSKKNTNCSFLNVHIAALTYIRIQLSVLLINYRRYFYFSAT